MLHWARDAVCLVTLMLLSLLLLLWHKTSCLSTRPPIAFTSGLRLLVLKGAAALRASDGTFHQDQ